MITLITEKEATYHTALCLVARIDDDLTRGVRHYRTRAGELLRTLDEVIDATLRDDLVVGWHCPQCDAHLTSLYLCPDCGIRYNGS